LSVAKFDLAKFGVAKFGEYRKKNLKEKSLKKPVQLHRATLELGPNQASTVSDHSTITD